MWKSRPFLSTLLCLFLLSACLKHQEEDRATLSLPSLGQSSSTLSSAPPQAKPFALIELFTSEGCSSCPPADALAGELLRKAEEKGQEVYLLAYHVDYWNRLGWKDPFSQAKFSQRQSWYAKIFVNNSIYTPQMIINGRVEFVGSKRSIAEEEIQKSLAQTDYVEASIELSLQADKIQYQLSKAIPNTQLYIAWVEKNLATEVKAGENRGRQLSHYSVLRDLDNRPKYQLKDSVSIPDEFLKNPENKEVVFFLQNDSNAHVLAAQKLKLRTN